MNERRLRWREALPIVARELRVASRRRFTYRVRMAVALLGAAQLILAASIPVSSPEAGRLIFWITSGLMILVCGGAGLLLTADSISREKREGTLGLLFLTRLGGADIVLGKLAAGAVSGGSVAFAALPFLAFSLCLGGIAAREFWVMSLLVLFLLAYSLSLGIFISALFRRESIVSLAFCIAMALPLALTPLAFMKWKAIPPLLACLNPFFPAIAFLDQGQRFFTHAVAKSALWQQGFLMVMMLLLASIILPWAAILRPARSSAAASSPSRALARIRSASQRELLDSNPVLWFSQRKNHPVALLLLCVGLRFVTSSAGATAFEAEVAFVALMAFLPKLFVLWHASGMMAAERQSGFLEALLTTPISARVVLEGKIRAVRRQLAPTLLFALLAQFSTSMSWWAAHGEIPPGTTLVFAAMITLLIDVHAAAWIGLWQGLTARDRRRALVLSILWGFVVPWLPVLGGYWILFAVFEPSWMNHAASLAAPALISANVLSFGIACGAMARLHEKFRSTATQTWSTRPAA